MVQEEQSWKGVGNFILIRRLAFQVMEAFVSVADMNKFARKSQVSQRALNEEGIIRVILGEENGSEWFILV